ncbi:thioesterase [Chitinispirillum alkaliphilum]|nr:thioesterase [Chitinispirillum alkaliphilum]
MSRQQHHEKLQRMYLNAAVNRQYEPKISVSRGEAEVIIEVKEDFFHSAHSVHGSVYFKVLDDSSYFAASSLVTDCHLVTVSYNLYFLRPVKEGFLRGVGKVVNSSRRVIVAESEVFDSRGKLAARGSGTFMKSSLPLDENVGYL